jgi:DNA-binding MarR family transcriptional regulator
VEAYLNPERTAELLSQRVDEAFERFGITAEQYSVLRILRGAGKTGIAQAEIAPRMIRPARDMGALLDELDGLGFATRKKVRATLTAAGGELFASMDDPVLLAIHRPLEPLGKEKLARLIELVEEVRIRIELSASK